MDAIAGFWRGLFRRRAAAEASRAVNLADLMAALRPVATDRKLIRIGAPRDGGYLVPDDLDDLAACFSPGVGNSASFEADLAGRGIVCFMADGSVDQPPLANPLFRFEKLFLGDVTDAGHIRLADWINRSGVEPGRDLLLQMDIEGDEFKVLLDTPGEVLRRFRIVVIEFHELHRLFEAEHFPDLSRAMLKLQRDFAVVHLHPNNCCPVVTQDNIAIPMVMEFTFYRRDRFSPGEVGLSFPHRLDSPNLSDRPNLVLPSCWQ